MIKEEREGVDWKNSKRWRRVIKEEREEKN
jgi:hypothetical protein